MKAWNNCKIDQRNTKDVLDELSELARAYTPEWKFDRENPDAGSVIALIFAGQTMENITRFNQVLEKHRTEFANMYGVTPKPARSARTIVIMQAGGAVVEGVPVKKGTRMTAAIETGQEVIFETFHDLFVTNISLTELLAVSRDRGTVTPLPMEWNMPTPLFWSGGENIRSQRLELYHSYLFDTAQELRIRFYGNKDSHKLARDFADASKYRFWYLSDQGETTVEAVCREDCVALISIREPLKTEKNGQEMALLAIEMVEAVREPVILERIELVTADYGQKPDMVSDGSKELAVEEFLPFGRQISNYDECYIGQREAFAQKGAKVTLEFDLSFEENEVRIIPEPEEDLRVIKRKPRYETKLRTEDCYIQEISVEYYNGKGYKRLPCESEVASLFATVENTGHQSITFEAPFDWESVTVGGYEERSLRLRVVRADNCYRNPVCYHFPIVRNMTVQVSYEGSYLSPQAVQRVSGEERLDLTGPLHMGRQVTAFSEFPYAHNYMYFGFDRKPEQGPIGMFLWLLENSNFPGVEAAYEYSTRNGFKPLNVIDHTGGLKSPGILLFEPPADMDIISVEGRKACYIRMADKGGYFSNPHCVWPQVKTILLNGVEAGNQEIKEEQEYSIDVVTADMNFSLYADHILRAEIWVNEKNQLTPEQMMRFQKEQPGKVRAEYNYLGEIEDFYVLWQEAESFENNGGSRRVYVLNRTNNRIYFGDGKRVDIPRNTQGVAFKAIVTSCSGQAGNVAAKAIDGFQGSMLFVDEVSNPIPAYGGSDLEDLESTLRRGSNLLSGRRRLVSEQDYIRETLMYSDLIKDVALIDGEEAVSLALLMEDYRNGSFSFKSIEQGLREHLLHCCEMIYEAEELRIVEPVFVKISLELWIEHDLRKDIYELQQSWLRQMEEFLSPIQKDGTVQWPIGKLPRENQLRRMLHMLEKEVGVKHFSVSADYTDDKGQHRISLREIKGTPYMVCCNGSHRIHSKGSGDVV